MGIAAEASDVFRTHADRVFLVDSASGSELNYASVYTGAGRLAAELRDRGVGRGDRVATLLRNTPEFALLELGCLLAGATMIPVGPDLPAGDVEYILGISRPELVVCGPSTRELARAGGRPTWELVPHAEGGPPPAALCAGSDESGPLQADEDDIVTIHFTSGTTSRPKGVPHRLGSLLRNAGAFDSAVGVGPDHRFLHVFPMAYMAGFLNTILCPLMAGASVVLAPSFDARSLLRFWQPIVRHGVNAMWLSPTMLAALLRVDRDAAGKEYCRANMRTLCTATAPLPDTVRHEFEREYGVEVLNSYGLSELLIVAIDTPGLPRAAGSVGRALSEVEVRVADPNESGDGELLVRTPDSTPGYLTEDGTIPPPGREWFSTGDVGRVADDGTISVTGRAKDVIIRGGLNISPQAVEDALLQHPAVDDATVVGLPHDFYGEEVVAAVRLKNGRHLRDEVASLRDWCAQQLAQHARPTRFFEMESFPLGSTGKVQKGRLREILLAGEGSEGVASA